MNNQRTLPTGRDYDLPPFWDGHRVQWGRWEIGWITLCRERASCCPYCGSTERPPVCHGVIAGQKNRLWAYRCPDCRHDQVYELRGDSVWDLDESDYTDVGSFNE